ncbi:hypothetical protein EUX98_g3282 [Antrodiella citrinella]|uniref:Chromatin target of PRMT1 protein C-terminal domain-containing protein n=1 Tax=Antrodiella citrinella TaxID=2447956 RepID=A0A4S4MZG8_9APHY|nr:hypothetical protein EUX98_g3282 [Antrodiella citrinella]
MKIELVVENARNAPPTASLASRVAPAPAAAAPNGPAPARGAGGRPRRGVRGGAGRRKGGERPAKSAADLDAEMEDYTTSNGPIDAPAPAAAA